ncbi:hypothetical protein Dsin_030341 [Dipteronia sinensis]|uniref:Legume lectin domain-containing protein n=1 Tax=Dipteronia sinensis TaxID=43782 RepID=A0AAD9ZJD2_9ROSI|nr:hypothetical protein Dsin_030341 [Dipteronia sinensis]
MVPNGYRFTILGKSSFGLSMMGLHKSKSRVIIVEFDTSLDAEYDDLNGNHVGIDVDSLLSVKVCNISVQNMFLNIGKKLDSWIDYEASVKRLEVRLSHSSHKPVSPLLSYSIDLLKIWNDAESVCGIDLFQWQYYADMFCVYSWTFKSMHVPQWMHSQPLDTNEFANDTKFSQVLFPKRTDCLPIEFAALFFGTACGAFGTFIVLYLCSIFRERRPVVREECGVHTVVGLEYK